MVNGIGTLKVLQYAHLLGVERLVYASSGCGVYGLDSKMPFEEHDVSISLHTPYQVTKLLGELYTNYFHNGKIQERDTKLLLLGNEWAGTPDHRRRIRDQGLDVC